MKKIILFITAFVFIHLYGFSQTRYLDDIFTNVTITHDVNYATNISVLPALQGLPPAPESLYCDIYEPANDNITNRPVVILMHTGSFLPKVLNGQATGSRTDSSIVEQCKRWAKKFDKYTNYDIRYYIIMVNYTFYLWIIFKYK